MKTKPTRKPRPSVSLEKRMQEAMAQMKDLLFGAANGTGYQHGLEDCIAILRSHLKGEK